jgi:hypothetical protein
MTVETIGHAGVLVRSDLGESILFTDPWVTGSCYWRSWWLQNYPDESQLEELARVRYCFITHEHPDHFHTASIRRLGTGIEYLAPDLPQEHIAQYLSSQGFRASVVPAFTWKVLHPDVRILSIPLLNDDSALLIDTPCAVLINLNDTKPRSSQLRQLRRALDATVPGKSRVLLSSYSPASIVNSFVRNARRVSLKQKPDYVRYIGENCRILAADYYLPFASQVIYKRTDSAWANDFKVTYADLRDNWSAPRTQLLAPYTRLQLEDGAHTSVPPEHYRHDEQLLLRKVEAQQALDASTRLNEGEIARLRQKLGHCRWLLALLFPKGIGFSMETMDLHYDPWRGSLRPGTAKGDFILRVPAQAFRDAVQYGHFGDLGTTMFTMVTLNGNIHPRRVYLFFMLMTLHDYGHTARLGSLVRWLRNAARIHTWRLPRELPGPAALSTEPQPRSR